MPNEVSVPIQTPIVVSRVELLLLNGKIVCTTRPKYLAEQLI
ncbi:MAG TPA: hypothetical protein VJJ80_00580 [Patescibacteria group bacterium]|nr:hypothetical protein [Patescibacteria group bacterium]